MTKIPSLADALAAAQAPAGPDCTVKLMALTLTKSEREALRAAFAPDSTTPERGVTMQAPIFVADPKAEGWRR